MTTCHCGAERETYDVYDPATGETVDEETVCPWEWHPDHPEE